MKNSVLLRRLTEFSAELEKIEKKGGGKQTQFAKRWDPETRTIVDDDPPISLLKPAAATVGTIGAGAGLLAGHRAVMHNYGGGAAGASQAYTNAGRNLVKTGSDFLRGRVAAAKAGAIAGRVKGEALGAKGGAIAADLVAKLRKALAGKKLFDRPEGARLVELTVALEPPLNAEEWRPGATEFRRLPEQDDTHAPKPKGTVANHLAGIALAGLGVAGAARTIRKAGGIAGVRDKITAARAAARLRRVGKGFATAAAMMKAAG